MVGLASYDEQLLIRGRCRAGWLGKSSDSCAIGEEREIEVYFEGGWQGWIMVLTSASANSNLMP